MFVDDGHRASRLARHAVAEVGDSRAEGAGPGEFEIHPAPALGKERNATANQHRVDPGPVLVDPVTALRAAHPAMGAGWACSSGTGWACKSGTGWACRSGTGWACTSGTAMGAGWASGSGAACESGPATGGDGVWAPRPRAWVAAVSGEPTLAGERADGSGTAGTSWLAAWCRSARGRTAGDCCQDRAAQRTRPGARQQSR